MGVYFAAPDGAQVPVNGKRSIGGIVSVFETAHRAGPGERRRSLTPEYRRSALVAPIVGAWLTCRPRPPVRCGSASSRITRSRTSPRKPGMPMSPSGCAASGADTSRVGPRRSARSDRARSSPRSTGSIPTSSPGPSPRSGRIVSPAEAIAARELGAGRALRRCFDLEQPEIARAARLVLQATDGCDPFARSALRRESRPAVAARTAPRALARLHAVA